MGKTFEKYILRALFLFGIASFINLVRKPPVKDWLLIFFLKGYMSSILDKVLVREGYITYPTKFFKKFDVSIIFDYVLFPISCVYFNQVTEKSRLTDIFIKLFYFSVPMALGEAWLEMNTQVIKYKKGWTPLKSFISLSLTFLVVRGVMYLIRRLDMKQQQSSQKNNYTK
ncbi:CBO0543 family protein [Litchfieldia alkalitelluris]|uniref:CBO0543 family protein n=1 Tax=Litchfieldia alkalitelluris TaxID=304268 RepID=UPI0009969472|nr:CBO0543 family protein [Litchfieldia alkalitelluris]